MKQILIVTYLVIKLNVIPTFELVLDENIQLYTGRYFHSYHTMSFYRLDDTLTNKINNHQKRIKIDNSR